MGCSIAKLFKLSIRYFDVFSNFLANKPADVVFEQQTEVFSATVLSRQSTRLLLILSHKIVCE